jgi:hypothetical protein
MVREKEKKLLSGEISKEPGLDVLLTNSEQTSFSLLGPNKQKQIDIDFVGVDRPDSSYVDVDSISNSNSNSNSEKKSFRPISWESPHRIREVLSLRRVLSYAEQAQTNKNKNPTLSRIFACSASCVLSEAEQAKSKNDFLLSEAEHARTEGKGGSSPALKEGPLQRSATPTGTLSKTKNVLLQEQEQVDLTFSPSVSIGNYVNSGDKIGELFGTPLIIGESGRVITLTKTQITIQKTQPVRFYSDAKRHVKKNEWVKRGSPILTLTHQTLVTGDIVQGIPQIERLFEAVSSSPSALPDDKPTYETLNSQTREIFRKNWSKVPFPSAVRQTLEEIQQIIVESIQKVYLSQGVLIADKHIEIIVKQMTSKGQIVDSGDTGFMMHEVLPLQKIENANLTTAGKKAVYVPAVVGLTRTALNSDSFVSAASFQETTRVLTRDAVAGKSDFLRGLKEKVVVGDLISAGTGLDLFLIYTVVAENIFDAPKRIKDSREPPKRAMRKVLEEYRRKKALTSHPI